MRITILGSTSGTEPMPARHHTSIAIEAGGNVYWLDAGEGCSHTAHVAGIDIMATRAILISHPHMDHVGGLPNLLWTIRKLEGRNDDPARSVAGKRIDVLTPSLGQWRGILTMLGDTEGGFARAFGLEASTYADGVIFDDGVIKVIAQHNLHLGVPADGVWTSFSFRVESEGSALVFSGDVKDVRDVEPILSPCDLFLMETGHHKVEDVCAYLAEGDVDFGRLCFVHHGRAILADPGRELRKAQSYLGDKVTIAYDGMAFDL